MCARLATSTHCEPRCRRSSRASTFDGLIETEPREEAIIGFHFLRDDDGVATEPFVRKTPLAMPGNSYSSCSELY